MSEVRLAFDAQNHLGETPVWSEKDQALWCGSTARSRPNCIAGRPPAASTSSGRCRSESADLAEKASGGMLVALADGIYDFDLASGAAEHARAPPPLPPQVKLHESAVDRQGAGSGSAAMTTIFRPIARRTGPNTSGSMATHWCR